MSLPIPMMLLVTSAGLLSTPDHVTENHPIQPPPLFLQQQQNGLSSILWHPPIASVHFNLVSPLSQLGVGPQISGFALFHLLG